MSNFVSGHYLTYAVIFDLDGTLFDSENLALEGTNVVLRNHGLDKVVDQAEYYEGCRYPTKQRLAWHATGDADDEIGARLQIEFDEFYIALVTNENPRIYDGILKLLARIKECEHAALGILSNASESYVKRVVAAHGLDNMFKATLGIGIDLTVGKPQPDGLYLISSMLNIPPARCVYIGDSPTDGQAARAARMLSIGVTWGNSSSSTLRGIKSGWRCMW